ncbi:hypothetical protein [Acetobacter syzygii]|uniref:hypothetical protein n=1 Tax=Acetobacter syzygii TaxID=146476 RepID=UPI0039E73A9E
MSEKIKKSGSVVRNMPPAFPMGFGFGISDDFMIIDFIDPKYKNGNEAFYSIALLKGSAENLYDALGDFLGKKKDG